MVKLFFSLVFVLPLLGRLLPVGNTLVQTIYMQYLSSFAGLHTVTLFINYEVFSFPFDDLVFNLGTLMIFLILLRFAFRVILSELMLPKLELGYGVFLNEIDVSNEVYILFNLTFWLVLGVFFNFIYRAIKFFLGHWLGRC